VNVRVQGSWRKIVTDRGATGDLFRDRGATCDTRHCEGLSGWGFNVLDFGGLGETRDVIHDEQRQLAKSGGTERLAVSRPLKQFA
jgi:hypothetical protein